MQVGFACFNTNGIERGQEHHVQIKKERDS